MGGRVDGSKATGKQGELGRNAGGGDKWPLGCAEKNRHLFFFSFFITYENHLLIFVLNEALWNLWELLSTLAALKSHPTGLVIHICFEKSNHRNHSSPAWCKKKSYADMILKRNPYIYVYQAHVSSTTLGTFNLKSSLYFKMFKNRSESQSVRLDNSLKHTQLGVIWPEPAHWWLESTICGLNSVESSPWLKSYFHFLCWNYAEHLFQQITYLKQGNIFVSVKTFFATQQ